MSNQNKTYTLKVNGAYYGTGSYTYIEDLIKHIYLNKTTSDINTFTVIKHEPEGLPYYKILERDISGRPLKLSSHILTDIGNTYLIENKYMTLIDMTISDTGEYIYTLTPYKEV